MCPNDGQEDDVVETISDNTSDSEDILEDISGDESLEMETLEAAVVEDAEPDFTDEVAFPSYQHGKHLTKAMDATQIYLSEIGFSPLLSAEEEVHYSTLSLQGNVAARKKMIESNLRLVVKI